MFSFIPVVEVHN